MLVGAGHHLARADDLADRRLGLALGLQADDLGRRGDRIAGGVLVEQFVGADLGFVALGLGHALVHRGAAGLHVGDADAVAIALDAGPVELAGQPYDDPAAAVDLQRLGRQLHGHEVKVRTDVVAVLRVQRQSGGLGFARADVGAAPVDLELRLLQRVHQQFRGVVGADRLAVHPCRVECCGACVDRGTEQRPGGRRAAHLQEVYALPLERAVEQRAPGRGAHGDGLHGWLTSRRWVPWRVVRR